MTVPRFLLRMLAAAAPVAMLTWALPAAADAASGSTGASAIFAAERTPLHIATSAAKTHTSSGVGGSLLRTVFALIVVIAVIYGVTWVLRRMRRSQAAKATGSGLASVATLPLGTNRSLHLVRAGADLILVGSSEHGVCAIRSYTEEDARSAGLLGEDPPAALERLVSTDAVEWAPAPDWHERPRTTHAPGTIGHAIESLRRLTAR